MASDDESSTVDHHHDEKDWEAHKEPFRVCYIDNRMTRKEAALYLKEHYNFDATPRQWERKIKQWGFGKYSSREERLNQIASSGKSVYEVSRPGRRPRAYVDDRGNLHPNEDRNLRRFARREVSRSRSRSRSNSFANHSRPQVAAARDALQPEYSQAADEQRYDLDIPGAAMLHSHPQAAFDVPAAPSTQAARHSTDLTFLQAHHASGYAAADDTDLLLDMDDKDWSQAQLTDFTDPLIPNQPTLAGSEPDATLQYPMDVNRTPFHYGSIDPSVPSAPGFDQYTAERMGVTPAALHENVVPQQRVLSMSSQASQRTAPMEVSEFDGQPIFTLDVVDMDPTTNMQPIDDPGFPSLPNSGVESGVPGLMTATHGPLHNDVAPLMEEYAHAVHAAALWCISNDDGNDFGARLATSLNQPSQVFMAKMAVVLDNFAKSQQRAFQSMRDTCGKLRQKNALLKQIISNGSQIRAASSQDALPHRSSLPAQPAMYGQMYAPTFS